MVNQLDPSTTVKPTAKSRLGIKAFLVAVLTIIIVAVSLAFAPAESPSGDTNRSVKLSSDSANSADEGAKLFSTFDVITNKRRRARDGLNVDLDVARRSADKAVARQAIRAANVMVSAPFVQNVAIEFGRGLGDQSRVWELFEDQLDDMGDALGSAYKAFDRINARYTQNLQRDQGEYRVIKKPSKAAATPIVAFPQSRPNLAQAEIKKRIMRKVSARLKKEFPKEIEKGTFKWAKKQASTSLASVFDGPFPIIDATLIVIALSEFGTGVVEFQNTVELLIAETIEEEGKAILLDAYMQTREQALTEEKLAQEQQCEALRMALTGLIFPAKDAEFGKRCNYVQGVESN